MTAQAVTDEILGVIARKQWDLFRRVKEGTLDPLRVSESLQAISEGRFDSGAASTFRFDLRQDGWELTDPAMGQAQLIVTKSPQVEFVSILRPGEGRIDCETLKRRAREMIATLGQKDAEFLHANQHLIPHRSPGVRCVPFVGTIWRDRDGVLKIPCLTPGAGMWDLRWLPLDDAWHSDACFLRPRR